MSLKLNERYPGRFNNPSADYPGGSFKNRTTPDAKDGSYLEKDWANDKEGFFQSIIAATGSSPNGLVDKVGASQFFDCLLQLTQSQVAQAFSTAGTTTALVLTPVPAISAYTANQRFSVKFHVASGANPTMNISAKGAKSLKQYDSSGAKVAAAFASGQVADVVYDGVDVVVLDPLPVAAISDPWEVQPIGVPIPLFTHIPGVTEPPTNKSYRYIKLTASDSYNAGVLTGESVSGSAPDVVATATISVAGSSLNGQSVSLINTMRRVLKSGAAGVLEADLLGPMTYSVYAPAGTTPSNLYYSGAATPVMAGTASTPGSYVSQSGNGSKWIGNTGVETRVKSIGATYYMRVK